MWATSTEEAFFKENGKQATHAINMAFKKLLNLSTSSEPYEAATKEYVNERPHIIAVHANYHGPLRRDEYQFAFGGSVINLNGSTGFLVPLSGRIKKIKAKVEKGEDNYGWQNNSNVFTIVTNNLEIKDLVSFKSTVFVRNPPKPNADRVRSDENIVLIEFRFDRDATNILVSDGDTINIRSDCDIVIREGKRDCTYLVTILLELDPL